MVLLIPKRWLAAALGCCVLTLGAAAWLIADSAALPAIAGAEMRPVVVVDPGHGGEDGGAVGADGTVESGLNLEIAGRVNDLLRFCGVETRMTRKEDVSIHSGEAATLRQKKVSDLQNRAALVNDLDSAVLLSLHQNCFPSVPQVHGAQVFYNASAPAQTLALEVQASLNGAVNAGNEKQSKPISGEIYLMKNVHAPAVLVECGFLSNREETQSLKTPDYQRKLAAAITAGLLRGLAGGEELP